MNKWMPVAFLLILAAGLALRAPHLAERPMHHDEANQAYRFGMLLEEGSYEYDRDDHHGPTLYYLTLPMAWLSGADTFASTTEITYRSLPVVFGMALILGSLLFRGGLGWGAILAAALFTALSPAMAYYSRFYIQEILLVFFTLVTLAAAWRFMESDSVGWSIICGAGAGLMFATKETAVISFAAMLGSLVVCMLIARQKTVPVKGLIYAAASAAVIWFVLFSSFLSNQDGPLESIVAFKGYLTRGAGVDTDHVHPWSYYLTMLTRYRVDGGPVWSEALIFGLGLTGCLAVVLKKVPGDCDLRLARFLMIYTVLLTFVYSALPYKTPWCILSFLHGWILLAGIGASSIWVLLRSRKLLRSFALLLLVLGCAQLARTAHRTVFRYATDYRNPYVYAHTTLDFMNLIERIDDVSAVSGKSRELYIQVIADPKETWPLPFYLRDYPNVGYWTGESTVPDEPCPDVVISSADFVTDPNAYQSEYYGLRPDRLLSVHIRQSLWEQFIQTRE
jgi:uncharacterized protein (TIGR03663 family)